MTNVTLKWLDVSGAQSLHNADGSPMTGTGVAIGGGAADDTTIMQYLRVHDNDANGVGSPRGKVLNSEFFRNTLDPAFLGYAGAAVKGIYEYEAAYNFVHDEQGNGLWCDHSCYDQGRQPNGFWVHHNLLVNNDRYGVRYEYSPRVASGTRASQPSALVENNEIHGNGYGGTSMQDAQNGVFRYNTFGQATIDGVPYAHNGAGPKAMQFSEGNKTTSLYNAEAYGNNLRRGVHPRLLYARPRRLLREQRLLLDTEEHELAEGGPGLLAAVALLLALIHPGAWKGCSEKSGYLKDQGPIRILGSLCTTTTKFATRREPP